jgi:hypothetical protein
MNACFDINFDVFSPSMLTQALCFLVMLVCFQAFVVI